MALPSISAQALPLFQAASGLSGVFVALAAGIGVSAALWATRLPKLAIAGLLLSLLAGQLVRLELPGQGGGVLLSDIAVVLVLLCALALFVRGKRSELGSAVGAERGSHHFRLITYNALLTPFLAWSLFTLAIRVPQLGMHDSLIAGAYWARLTAYLLLVPALAVLVRRMDVRMWLHRGFLVGAGSLALAGFIQLAVFPNLAPLAAQGWDPHQGRLVSTWLDPNFLGIFFVVTLAYAASYCVRHAPDTRRRWPAIGPQLLVALSAGALALTQSRSALLALVGGLVLVSPLLVLAVRRTRHVVAVSSGAVILLVFMVGAGALLGSRAIDAVYDDPNVIARVSALSDAWEHIAAPHAWTGVGYNAYQFAARDAGLIGGFSIHSRAGADSSWLTLMATTGVIGVALFALPWLYVLRVQLAHWLRGRNPHALAGAAALVALTIHSQVVNSFLYAHVLAALAIIVVLSLSRDHVPKDPQ